MSFKHKTELQCNYCSQRIWSEFSGEFTGHVCKDAGKISTKYNHDTKQYEPDYPFMAVEETYHYCRIIGYPKDFTVVDVDSE